MASKQSLLDQTNRAMLCWVQQQRTRQQHIPLAVFKSKAIRVYRDLKTQLNPSPDLDAQLGTLKADRRWFLSFLEKTPIRYDTFAETLVCVGEMVGHKERYVVRKADMQFIFDESGDESSDDDDVIIVLPDTPPGPEVKPPPKTPSPTVTPVQLTQRMAVVSVPRVQVQQIPTPVPQRAAAAAANNSMNSTQSLAMQRGRRQIVAKQAATPPAPAKPTPPPPATRRSSSATSLPPPTTARVAAAAAAKRGQVAPPTVPPLKIKLPAKAAAAAAAPAPPPAPPTPPVLRQKKVKMVSRSIQVAMEVVAGKGRVFKNDNLNIKRRVTTIQRLKALKTWVKSQDSCQERIKLVMHYFEQIFNLYNTRDDAVKAFEEKQQKRLQKLAAAREEKKKLKKEEEEMKAMIKIKRSRSPTPPSRVTRMPRALPNDDDPQENGEASAMVQCVLDETEPPPRVRVKREPVERPVAAAPAVRIKAEPRDRETQPVPETEATPDPPVPVVRIKREPTAAVPAVRIKKEPSAIVPAVRVKKEPREVVNIKLERGIKSERIEATDLGLGITAVSGDVPMSMLTGGEEYTGTPEEESGVDGMTISAVNGGVALPPVNGEGAEEGQGEQGTGGLMRIFHFYQIDSNLHSFSETPAVPMVVESAEPRSDDPPASIEATVAEGPQEIAVQDSGGDIQTDSVAAAVDKEIPEVAQEPLATAMEGVLEGEEQEENNNVAIEAGTSEMPLEDNTPADEEPPVEENIVHNEQSSTEQEQTPMTVESAAEEVSETDGLPEANLAAVEESTGVQEEEEGGAVTSTAADASSPVMTPEESTVDDAPEQPEAAADVEPDPPAPPSVEEIDDADDVVEIVPHAADVIVIDEEEDDDPILIESDEEEEQPAPATAAEGEKESSALAEKELRIEAPPAAEAEEQPPTPPTQETNDPEPEPEMEGTTNGKEEVTSGLVISSVVTATEEEMGEVTPNGEGVATAEEEIPSEEAAQEEEEEVAAEEQVGATEEEIPAEEEAAVPVQQEVDQEVTEMEPNNAPEEAEEEHPMETNVEHTSSTDVAEAHGQEEAVVNGSEVEHSVPIEDNVLCGQTNGQVGENGDNEVDEHMHIVKRMKLDEPGEGP